MVLRQLLDEAVLVFLEGDEILDDVEKPRRTALPLISVSRLTTPASSSSSIRFHSLKNSSGARARRARPRARGEDHEGVRRKDMRDRCAVIGEVAVEASAIALWLAFSSTNRSGRPLTKPTRSARLV